MSAMSADVSVVVVTFNSGAYIQRCLTALASSSYEPSAAYVIDNASTDGTPEIVAREFPGVRLVKRPDNDGFGVASNVGIRLSAPSEYVLLLNPDAVLSRGSLAILVHYMDEHADVGIAGCRLLNEDCSLQHSIGKFPTVANQLGRALMLYRLFPWLPALQELEGRRERYSRTHDVEWLLGAVMLVRRRALETVGLFDGRFFLFSEEVDLCLRMERQGWRVCFVADTSVKHVGRGGVGSAEVYVHLLRSKYEFIAKHHGRVAAESARALLLVGLVIRWVITAAYGLLGSPSSRRRRRAFASGIRWAFGPRGAP